MLEGKSREIIDPVLAFSSAVGLPITLSQIGLDELPTDLLEEIAARAVADGETIHNEPFEVKANMVSDALLAADSMGRAWQEDNT